MQLAPSAHVDTFTRDNLPPLDQLPPFDFRLPELRYPQRINCAAELLDRMVDRGPDRRCLLAPGPSADADPEMWRYHDLLRRANQVAGYLTAEVGLVPGNRVLLRAPNNPWLVACWFGVVKAGCVAVTTMPLLRAGELRTIHEIARIDHSLSDHRFVDDLAAAGIGRYTVVGAGGTDSLEVRAARQPTEFSNVDTSADDVALLAFTSGTTGRPKATMHFHRDVLAVADTFSAHVLRPVDDDLRGFAPARLHIRAGLPGDLSAADRRGLPAVGEGHARPPPARDRALSGDGAFTAPTAYRAMLAGSVPVRRLVAATLRLGRRAAAAGDLAGVARRDRN